MLVLIAGSRPAPLALATRTAVAARMRVRDLATGASGRSADWALVADDARREGVIGSSGLPPQRVITLPMLARETPGDDDERVLRALFEKLRVAGPLRPLVSPLLLRVTRRIVAGVSARADARAANAVGAVDGGRPRLPVLVVVDRFRDVQLHLQLLLKLARAHHLHIAVCDDPSAPMPLDVTTAFGRVPSASFSRMPVPARFWRPLTSLAYWALDLLGQPVTSINLQSMPAATPVLPPVAAALAQRLARLPALLHAHLRRMLLAVEAAIPRPEIDTLFRQQQPAVTLFTSLFAFEASQLAYVRASRQVRSRTIGLVSAWDEVTHRGRLREVPDVLGVWNATQRREVITRHGVPGQKTSVVGPPSGGEGTPGRRLLGRAELLAAVRAPADCAIVVVTFPDDGNPRLRTFVLRWLQALRAHDDDRLREALLWFRWPAGIARWSRKELRDVTGVYSWAPGAPLKSGRLAGSAALHADAMVVMQMAGVLEAVAADRAVVPLVYETRGGTELQRFLESAAAAGQQVGSAHPLEHLAQLARVLSPSAAVPAPGRDWRALLRPHGRAIPSETIVASRLMSEVLEFAPPPRGSRRWPRALVSVPLLPLAITAWALEVAARSDLATTWNLTQRLARTRPHRGSGPIKYRSAPHGSLSSPRSRTRRAASPSTVAPVRTWLLRAVAAAVTRRQWLRKRTVRLGRQARYEIGTLIRSLGLR